MVILEIERDEVNKNIEEITSSSKTAVFLILSKFLSFIILAISFVVVTRILRPSNYGIYTLIITIVGLFGIIGNMGIGTALNKFISEYKYKNKKREIEIFISNSFFILIIIGSIFTIAMLFSSGAFAHYVFHTNSVLYLLQISSLIILITILYSSAISALIGFNNGIEIVIVMFTEAILQTIISIMLLLYNFGIISPILGIIFGQLIGFIIAIYFLFLKPKIKIIIQKKAIKRILSFSVPITVSNIIGGIVPQLAPIALSTIIIYFPWVAVTGFYVPSNSVVMGNYGIASKISYFIDVILGSISLSLLSLFSKLFSNKNIKNLGKFYNYAIFLAFVFIGPILFFIFVLSKEFSYTLFSGNYSLAPSYLKIISIGILISIFGMYANILLISKSKVKEVMKIGIIITVIQLIILPILLLLFEGIGLIILLFLVQPILSSILLLRKIRLEFKVNTKFLKIFKVLIANILTFVFIIPFILIIPSQYIILLAIGIILVLFAYPVFLAKTTAVTKDDLNTIKIIIKDIPIIKLFLNFYIRYVSFFINI